MSEARTPMFLFRTANNDYIYVSTGGAKRTSDSIDPSRKVYVSDAGKMLPLEVECPSYLGGDEEDMSLRRGCWSLRFRVPSKQGRERGHKATWAGHKLEEVNLMDYNISETEDGVVIRKIGSQPVSAATARTPLHLFKICTGGYIYVSAEGPHKPFAPSYDSVKVYMTEGDKMVAQPTPDTNEFSSATALDFHSGRLLIPSNFCADCRERAKWHGRDLTTLNLIDFDITETEDSVTIRKL